MIKQIKEQFDELIAIQDILKNCKYEYNIINEQIDEKLSTIYYLLKKAEAMKNELKEKQPDEPKVMHYIPWPQEKIYIQEHLPELNNVFKNPHMYCYKITPSAIAETLSEPDNSWNDIEYKINLDKLEEISILGSKDKPNTCELIGTYCLRIYVSLDALIKLFDKVVDDLEICINGCLFIVLSRSSTKDALDIGDKNKRGPKGCECW